MTILHSIIEHLPGGVPSQQTRNIVEQLIATAMDHDNETGNHVCRTQHYVEILAHALRHHPAFPELACAKNRALIALSAPLHDLGKIDIPGNILFKPAKYTEEEFEVMKEHPLLGYRRILDAEREAILAAARDNPDGLPAELSLPELRFAKEIVRSHHEKVDGSGYPDKRVGAQIPVSARLMALADVFDALSSERPYKPAWSHDQVVNHISRESGKHFDPDVVEAFLANESSFITIARKFADKQEEVRAEAARRMLSAGLLGGALIPA